jgi:hypothetical protein
VTTGTTGTIVIDLGELWYEHWVRAWRDLGKLVWLHANEEHIPTHEMPNFGFGGPVGHCECFNCRVVDAWRRRYG